MSIINTTPDTLKWGHDTREFTLAIAYDSGRLALMHVWTGWIVWENACREVCNGSRVKISYRMGDAVVFPSGEPY